MARSKVIGRLVGACLCGGLIGCMPKMTVEELKAMMPERPAELDKLDAFVGKWKMEGTATMCMLDEPLEFTGTSESRWAGDGWYVVCEHTGKMGPFPDSSGIETWMYDIHAKKFRSSWVDSMGMTGNGVGTYDEKTGTWLMSATMYSPWGQSKVKGDLRFPDPDTMEFTWTEYQGFTKIMEMNATAKRVK